LGQYAQRNPSDERESGIKMKPTIHEAPDMQAWYHANFPNDDIWKKIPAASFQCLLESLLGENRHDVYHWCAGDSIVRER